ncbi:hypothetical protein AaE_007149, partial [Aphanomyces astaci]
TRTHEAMAAPVMTRRQRTATNLTLPELSLPRHRRVRASASDAPTALAPRKVTKTMFDDIVILKNKKHVVIPEKMHGKTADAKGSKRRRTPPALPAGVKLINPHYSSGTDEDDMEEADAPVVGQGFPPSLRTLEKDTILMRKQYPGLDVQVIEQVLVDTIPKEQNQHSYNAILTEAAARLEKLHDDVITARRRTLRHVD